MHYYEYLSSTKATRRTDGAKSLSIHDKLAAVEDWIYAHEPVGNPDEPDVDLRAHRSDRDHVEFERPHR